MDLEQLAVSFCNTMTSISELKLNRVGLMEGYYTKGHSSDVHTAYGFGPCTTVDDGTRTPNEEGGRRVGGGAPSQGAGMSATGIGAMLVESIASLGAMNVRTCLPAMYQV